MKKSLLTLLGAGLLLTSCQSDEPFAPGEGGEKQVTFTLNVPGELGTRAAAGANQSDKGGATNQGAESIKYTLVLEANNDTLILDHSKATVSGTTATFKPTVVLGRNYKITAYASLKDAWDGENPIAITNSFNDESKDAYYKTLEHNFANGDLQPLTLTRPFGKLRLVAEDYDPAKTKVESVKITYANPQHGTFDATTETFTIASENVAGTNKEFGYYEAADVAGAHTIFAEYLPTPKDKESEYPVSFTVEVKYDGSTETYSRTFNDIPVRRNALTTLSGNFFTANSKITVKVDENFDNTKAENIEFVSVSTASQLQDAIENGGDGETIILANDIVLTEPLVFGVNPSSSAPTRSGATNSFVLNLNGKTIEGTDTGTASYGLITIKKGADLTIEGNGTISLTATQNRGWNAYSSVISNQQGKLTVNGGTIEHFGGTDMAYAIDNLTNGKGTYAETIINGGTIKSTYRAIRQFLNATDAQNILTVNGGTIESTRGNKSIWMQGANKNANSGTLKVYGKATINSDIYIDMPEGTTTWDVEAYIEKAALKNGSTIITENIPEGCVTVAVSTADQLVEALEKNFNVYFLNDIKIDPASMSNAYGTTGINVASGQDMYGNGYTLNIAGAGGTWDSGVCARGGLIKDITIKGAFRGIFIREGNEPIVLRNVTLEDVVYTISIDQANNQGVEAYNSTFKGWTSYASTIGRAKFEDCSFAEGNGYAFCRPYAPTTFVGCDFAAGFELEAVAAVTFEKCTIGGVALTADNLATLVIGGIDKATVK